MSSARQWLPRSIECLRDYTAKQFSQDLIAGLTVGLVALPLAMAFAIASGVPPQAGLYTAVVAGFLISALGGSRTQIGGPTGAFVVIVAGIVVKFGLAGLALVGIMAGLLLLVMGLTGLGSAVKYIPRPVTIGFTNGIALLIASTQIKDFLGLEDSASSQRFLSSFRDACSLRRDNSVANRGCSSDFACRHSAVAAIDEANPRFDRCAVTVNGSGRWLPHTNRDDR